MSYNNIVEALQRPIVRLRPSNIPNSGVGVFAVTRIPKDTLVFKPTGNYLIEWKLIPEDAVDYLKTICNTQPSGVILDCEPNKIYTAYYVNHSQEPNLAHDLETDEYWSIRDIQPGEELTCYYLPKERNWVNVSKS